MVNLKLVELQLSSEYGKLKHTLFAQKNKIKYIHICYFIGVICKSAFNMD